MRTAGQRTKDTVLAYLFLLPALAIFTIFAYYPLYRLFWYATHRQSRFRNRPSGYVGFRAALGHPGQRGLPAKA